MKTFLIIFLIIYGIIGLSCAIYSFGTFLAWSQATFNIKNKKEYILDILMASIISISTLIMPLLLIVPIKQGNTKHGWRILLKK